jgi:hypothetical protein
LYLYLCLSYKLNNIDLLNFFNNKLNWLNNFWLNLFIYLFLLVLIVYNNNNFFFFLIFILNIYLFKVDYVLYDFYFGYFKIHPLLFYITLNFTLFNIIKNNHNNWKISKFFIVIINCFTFLLGSLWSLYQNVWGYYWTNDSIEYILLFFIFTNTLKIHKFLYYRSIFKNILFLFIILLVVLLRLKLIYTKHNFFLKKVILSKNLFFFFNYFFFNYLFITKKVNISVKIKINYYSVVFILLIYSIVFNYLNNFYIKVSIYFFSYLIVYYSLVNFFNNVFKKVFIHTTLIAVFVIYNNYFINYLIKNNKIYIYNNFNNNNFFKKNINYSLFFSKLKHNVNFYFQKKKKIFFNKIENTHYTNKFLINFF